MFDSFPEPIRFMRYEEAFKPMYLAIGRAVTTWAKVESSLTAVLQVLTTLNHASARAIFFSSGSFDGKLRVTKAALEVASLSETQKNCISKLLGIARTYSSTRNMIVHRQPVLFVSGELRVAVLQEGQRDTEPSQTLAEGITAEDIEQSIVNFGRLGWLLHSAAFPPPGSVPEEHFPWLIKLAGLLPADPVAKQSSGRQRGRERQERAASRIPIPTRGRAGGD